ncbi:MAG: hypothetical protein KF734_14930 [Saprospiraceae bacterium]|nr:hypothetical protein [Saprospiraceae bacterium]
MPTGRFKSSLISVYTTDTLCMAVPNWSGATIEAEAECQDTSIRFRLRNTGSTPSQLLDYIIIEDDVVLMQGQDSYAPGEEKIIDRPANGRTWRVESHPYTWELSAQGVASFAFSNIILPDSATNLAASQGFVMFKIDQQPDVPLQAQIFNSAAIYFDFNPPVITNQTLHTVGTEYLVGTSSPTNVRKTTRVAVFPNPIAEWAAFQLKEGIFNQHRLVVTDAFGRNVTEAVVSGRQYLFQRKALPPGIYFFRVEESSGQLIEAGNFILR